MLVGVISDTHDNLPMIRRAIARFGELGVECLIHAGDFIAPFALKEVLKFEGPVYAVCGNNDGERKGLKKLLPGLKKRRLRVKLGGKRVIVVHREEKLKKDDLAGSDLVVVGHTHAAEVRQGRPLLVNPGECAGWLKGIATIATVDTETLQARIINLDGP